MLPRWSWSTILLAGSLLLLPVPTRAAEPPSLPAIPGLAEALGLPEIPRFPGTPDTQVQLNLQAFPTPTSVHTKDEDPLFGDGSSLAERLAELRRQRDALDDEIETIEAALAGKPLIQLDVRIIALDWLRLRRLGMPLFSLQELCNQPCPAGLALPDESVPRMLELLEMQQIARSLSHRQLVTPSGTPTRIRLEAVSASALKLAAAELNPTEELHFACELSEDRAEIRFRFPADPGVGEAERCEPAPDQPGPEHLDLRTAMDSTILVVASSRPAEQPDRSVLVLFKPVRVREADDPQP
jgi:hypothetical protein